LQCSLVGSEQAVHLDRKLEPVLSAPPTQGAAGKTERHRPRSVHRLACPRMRPPPSPPRPLSGSERAVLWTLLGPFGPFWALSSFPALHLAPWACCRADLLRCFLLGQGCFASEMDWAGSRAHRFRDALAPPPPPPAALHRDRLTIHRDICTPPRAANRPPRPTALHRPPPRPRIGARSSPQPPPAALNSVSSYEYVAQRPPRFEKHPLPLHTAGSVKKQMSRLSITMQRRKLVSVTKASGEESFPCYSP
jgi:hypothetical protein